MSVGVFKVGWAVLNAASFFGWVVFSIAVSLFMVRWFFECCGNHFQRSRSNFFEIKVTFYHDFLILVRILKIDRTFWRQSYIFIFRSSQLFRGPFKFFVGALLFFSWPYFSLFINQASLDFFAQALSIKDQYPSLFTSTLYKNQPPTLY